MRVRRAQSGHHTAQTDVLANFDYLAMNEVLYLHQLCTSKEDDTRGSRTVAQDAFGCGDASVPQTFFEDRKTFPRIELHSCIIGCKQLIFTFVVHVLVTQLMESIREVTSVHGVEHVQLDARVSRTTLGWVVDG